MSFSCLDYFQCNKEAIFSCLLNCYINMMTADPGSVSPISGEVIISVVHEQKYSQLLHCRILGGKLPHLTILTG